MLWTSSLSSLACRTRYTTGQGTQQDKVHNRTKVRQNTQGVVILIGAVVTAATGVKGSRGQGPVFGVGQAVKDNLSNSSQDVYILCVCIAHSVVKCVQSNGQAKFFDPGHSCDYSAYKSDHTP